MNRFVGARFTTNNWGNEVQTGDKPLFSQNNPDQEHKIQVCFKNGFTRPVWVYKWRSAKRMSATNQSSLQLIGLLHLTSMCFWEARLSQNGWIPGKSPPLVLEFFNAIFFFRNSFILAETGFPFSEGRSEKTQILSTLRVQSFVQTCLLSKTRGDRV